MARAGRKEPAAALRDGRYPDVPLLPWLATDRLPAFDDHDAFLDFMDDPHRHPPAAPPASIVHAPISDALRAPPPPPGASALLGWKAAAAAAAEMGLGGRMMVVGAGETALGAATAPEGVGVPVAAEGIATAGAGLGLYEDGRRRWTEADRAARTAHPDPGPPVPPLVPPVAAPPPEGFSSDPKAARPHDLVTVPPPLPPANDGLVAPPSRGPSVVTIYGNGEADKIFPPKQRPHTLGRPEYDPTKTPTTHPDPQALLDAHSGHGDPPNDKFERGKPGFRERFNTGGEIVGIYRDPKTGVETPTTVGMIHYGRRGAHIVPARPKPPIDGDR